MLRAIARWFRSLGHFVTGRVDDSRRNLDSDPHAMRSQYDGIIRDKTKRIQEYKTAVAGLIAQQETKIGTLKQLTEELQRLEDLKAGALAKAQSTVAKLRASGAAKEAIHADDDYQQCLRAYNDFTATLTEKQARIDELETDITNYGKRIRDHKLQLEELIREIDQLKTEKSDAVAEVISAQQEKELAEALTGLGELESADGKLAELRQLRNEVKAEATLASELAGTDRKAQEAEFLEYARRTSGNAEFDKLIGLAEEADAAPIADSETASKDARTSLPE